MNFPSNLEIVLTLYNELFSVFYHEILEYIGLLSDM